MINFLTESTPLSFLSLSLYKSFAFVPMMMAGWCKLYGVVLPPPANFISALDCCKSQSATHHQLWPNYLCIYKSPFRKLGFLFLQFFLLCSATCNVPPTLYNIYILRSSNLLLFSFSLFMFHRAFVDASSFSARKKFCETKTGKTFPPTLETSFSLACLLLRVTNSKRFCAAITKVGGRREESIERGGKCLRITQSCKWQ